MDEELLKQEFGLGGEQNQPEPKNDQQQQDQQEEMPELNNEEQRAWDDGWRPEEQFEGDPTRWKTAREYNIYGEHQAEVRTLKESQKSMKAEFEERLSGVNKLHKAQVDLKVKELLSEQREAVGNGDTVEFDRIQEKIDDVKSQSEPVKPAGQADKDPTIAAWEEKNPWINAGGEKANDAIAIWNSYAQANPNGTIQDALSHVEGKISRLYPDEQPVNHRREQPSMSERPTQQAPRRHGRELTMNDLTMDERQSWQQFGQEMFGNEKAYLKAVSDARKQ